MIPSRDAFKVQSDLIDKRMRKPFVIVALLLTVPTLADARLRARCRCQLAFKVFLSLIGVLGVLVGPPAWAHQDPPGCNGVGVGIAIFSPFRADGVTPVGSGSVTNCETLVFKAQQVKYQPSTTSVPTCALEGGNLILTTPDGIDHTITTSIPCLGGTTNDPNSASNGGRGLCLGAPISFPDFSDPGVGVTYTVRDQDIVNGFIAVNAKYPETLGTSFNHTSDTDSVGGTATDQLPVAVVSCPVVTTGCEQAGCDPVTFACFDNHDTCPVANTGCEQAGCDPTKAFPGCFDNTASCKTLTNGCEQAGCDATKTFPGCFDNTNNGCRTADTFCEQAGCDLTATTFPACFVNDKGNGTPCGGTPGAPTPLECHTDCCEGGVCVGDSASCLQPDSTPCPDTDNIACSTPGCDAGVCNQNHIPCPTGICRTPGFWATHAGTEKGARSQNITLAVIQSTPTQSLNICGECIKNTVLNDAASAEEAMCVSPRGDQILQLARQLTAARPPTRAGGGRQLWGEPCSAGQGSWWFSLRSCSRFSTPRRPRLTWPAGCTKRASD